MSTENTNHTEAERLDKAAAEKLNDQIHKACSKIATDSFELVTLLEQAAAGQIHEALGYLSWTEWFAKNVAIEISNRDERQVMVALMSGKGMSQRAIASVVGVDQKTVSNDLRSGEENSSAATVGLDGKTYSREVEPKPRRRPITDEWRYAVDKLTKAVNRLNRLSEDDRFSQYRDHLAGNSDFERATNALNEVVNKLKSVQEAAE